MEKLLDSLTIMNILKTNGSEMVKSNDISRRNLWK
jgi:hypothetical protein